MGIRMGEATAGTIIRVDVSPIRAENRIYGKRAGLTGMPIQVCVSQTTSIASCVIRRYPKRVAPSAVSRAGCINRIFRS